MVFIKLHEKKAEILRIFLAKFYISKKIIEKEEMDHTQNSQDHWKDIPSGEKILTDVEAEELLKEIQRIRKEYGFRKE